VIYNAAAVKFYNATNGLARLGNKIIIFFFEKNALAYYKQTLAL
jgi:hypothetical protein